MVARAHGLGDHFPARSRSRWSLAAHAQHAPPARPSCTSCDTPIRRARCSRSAASSARSRAARRQGRRDARSHPLAGTAPRSADPTTDAQLAAALLASTKDQREHRITIDMVHETLLPWCSYLDEEAEPSIVAMADVQHLGTSVEGRLSDPPPSVLEMVAAVDPTPAVGDRESVRGRGAIRSSNPAVGERDARPGGLGHADRNGTFVVGIRSAVVEGRRARLWAGVGVVADSVPTSSRPDAEVRAASLASAWDHPVSRLLPFV
ncbi:MAG: chorismate-binding protein [Acidimicrobiia bacterium]|nr:chorismate-binding protein [Acidimicrobiia bacterium]